MTLLFGLPEHVVYATAGVWAVLIAATLLVFGLRLSRPGHYDELVHRTTSWWWMIGAPLYGAGTYNEFVAALEETMIKLGEEEKKPAWE